MKNFISLLCLSVCLALLCAGCGAAGLSEEPTSAPSHSHTLGPLQEGQPASFFSDGTASHYTCTGCGALFDQRGNPITELRVPKLSTDLTLWINGSATQLQLLEQGANWISWGMGSVSLSRGDFVTLRRTDDPEFYHAFTPQGNLDENGTVLSDAISASISLLASPEGLTLTVSREQYRGPELLINGREYLMLPDGSGYRLPVMDLHRGDVLQIKDPTFHADPVTVAESGPYRLTCCPSEGEFSAELLGAEGLSEAAAEFDRQILLCPAYLEQAYKTRLARLQEEYRLLSGEVKSRLKAAAKLEEMSARLKAAEAAPVIYCLTTPETAQVYPSREAMFRGFFTDFYYYIRVCHGTGKLNKWGLRTAEDFLELASDLEGGGYQELAGIGHATGGYLLKSCRNDVIQAQPEEGFLGFCYQNGLYLEQIPFFVRFYAYWRLDEGWATPKNCYADLFSETWAPTVDIAKFFYYDENTSPIRTARMLDCITSAAGVAYGMEEGTLPQPRLRGYRFEGWYASADFSGEPLTRLPQTEGQVTLYAKWSVDQSQRDADSAALMDVYLYNFFTQRAARNQTTAGYVLDMYNALTDEAKALITEEDHLQQFLKSFACPPAAK